MAKPRESTAAVFVAATRGKGRGVFAGRAFRRGERVEVSPVILLRRGEERGTLAHYVYQFGRACALALGLGSLFNHSRDPNLSFRCRLVRRQIAFYARRDVPAGQELTIDYGYTPTGYLPEPLDAGPAPSR